MKAIRIHNYGGPELLKFEDAPRPQPQPGEVLIRVHAAGVNPFDWKVREGYMKDYLPHQLPLILGWDVSGVVEAIGAGVSKFKKGEEVFALADPTRDGAYADYTAVNEALVAAKPKSLHHVRAAAVPLAALTAWRSLLEAGQLPKSDEQDKSHDFHGAIVATPSGAALTDIAKLIDAGNLKVTIDRILPLSEARRAHELSQAGHVRGKIVLRVKEEQP